MRHLLTLTAVASLLIASDASADTVSGGAFNFELHIPEEGGSPDDLAIRDDETIRRFFNTASCICGAGFRIRTTLDGASGADDREIQVWAGNACAGYATDAERQAECRRVGTIAEADDLIGSLDDRDLTVDQLVVDASVQCPIQETTQGVYYLIDDDVANDATWACTASVEVLLDMQEPSKPDGIEATPGEEAINIKWDASNQSDIRHYQALCKRSLGDPVAGEFGNDAAEYITSNTLCDTDGSIVDITGDNPLVPTELAKLDPSFVCGTATGNETSLRVEGLEDYVAYHVVLVAIDEAGNPSEPAYLGLVTPQPVRDFWEHYRDEGGEAQGGVCLATSTYGGNHPFTNAMRDFRDDVLASSALGRALIVKYYDYIAPLGAYVDDSLLLQIVAMVVLFPLVVMAAFFAYVPGVLQLLLFGWLAWRLLRRRLGSGGRRLLRPRWIGAATALVLLASPALANAQAAYNPYWETFDDDNQSNLQVGKRRPKWNLGLRLGPYFPDIDSEFSGKAPYEETFGGTDSMMFFADLERFFLYPGGQLGISASLGVMGASANSFQLSSDGTMVATDAQGNPIRAPGEKTRFRLIPSTVSVVYRFTALDDKARIPLVPYGKLGLAYYLWWISKPGGGPSRVRIDPNCVGQDCETTRALGASLGYTATIGIALRAERIDRQAAVNLRNEMGIHHAGFFAELNYAKVDGFGSSKKLSVGDATWYAGINFEF